MTIFVLLKGLAKTGLVTFHGVAVSDDAAQLWTAAGSSHWCHELDLDDGQEISATPIVADLEPEQA